MCGCICCVISGARGNTDQWITSSLSIWCKHIIWAVWS